VGGCREHTLRKEGLHISAEWETQRSTEASEKIGHLGAKGPERSPTSAQRPHLLEARKGDGEKRFLLTVDGPCLLKKRILRTCHVGKTRGVVDEDDNGAKREMYRGSR